MKNASVPFLVLALFEAACVRPTPLPVLGQIPPFHLTAQTGQPFDSAALDGHVWVADFVYTTCPGPCPRMSAKMRQIQTSTAETPGVLLVSMTVDPAHDTPPVLAEYGKRFLEDPARWFFLTGDMAALNDLGVHAFKLNSVEGNLSHSTRFVLVDRRRQIRGFYGSEEDSFMTQLLHDIRQLEQDRS